MQHHPTTVLGLALASLAMPVAAAVASPKLDANVVELDRAKFQKVIDGKKVDLYTLRNRQGMVVLITNYGAKI